VDAGNRQMVFRYEADTTLAALKDGDVLFIMDVR
jgi:Cu/Ag efflux protein CusF